MNGEVFLYIFVSVYVFLSLLENDFQI